MEKLIYLWLAILVRQNFRVDTCKQMLCSFLDYASNNQFMG